jgi:purine nucleosidase
MPTKLILDTDIGSDIDDAICLAYLLAQPECDLLGITTVSGEAEARAAMASAQCQVAGRDVPIYPGLEQPMLGTQRQPDAPQAAALERWPHRAAFPRGEAVEFLRRTIRAHPGEITLLTIGPLTNIGVLFALDPEIPSLLRELVIMGGVFQREQPRLEWNAMLDPVATAIVFAAAVPIRAIGLDVTLEVTMPAEEVRRRFDVRLLRPVLDFAEIWFRERPVITFHDPLAATTIFDPHAGDPAQAICLFKPGQVTVPLEGEPGRTVWQPGSGQHAIATQVHPNRFFEHYFSTVQKFWNSPR